MNNDILHSNWKKFRREAQKRWGRLTDDVLDKVNGDREELLGQIQKNYNIARDEAEKQVKEWEGRIAA